MVHLWWQCYVNRCGLVGVTLSNMMIMALSALLEVLWWIVYLIMWSMIISTYIRSNVKLCILQLMLFRWSCRLWLCSCMCGLRVDAWFSLLDYMSLWWLYWWWFGSVYNGKKMIMIIAKWLKEWHVKCVQVKYVVCCLGWLGSLT